MPKYFYKCNECGFQTSIYHSMNEVIESCPECNLPSFQKIPSFFNTEEKEAENKVGDIVRNSINEFADDLQKQKKDLKNEFFSKDK